MAVYANMLTALGWSLLSSIWQMAIMWVLFYLLTAGNTRLSPAGKHNLALVCMFIGTEWFIYTLVRFLQRPAEGSLTGFIPLSSTWQGWIPYLSLIYLLILAIKHIQSWAQLYGRLKKVPRLTGFEHLQVFTDRYVRILGIHRKVSVYLSNLAVSAETSGFVKPLIYLPVSLVTQLTARQIESIILHELFHIRRHDYLINIVLSSFRHIFFFNPFARLFCKAVCRERELACDDSVLEMGYEPGLYAEALFNLGKLRQIEAGLVLAADGNNRWLLKDRITRILGLSMKRGFGFSKIILVNGLIAVFVFCIQWQGKIITGREQVPKFITREAVKSATDFQSTSDQQKSAGAIISPPRVHSKKNQKIKAQDAFFEEMTTVDIPEQSVQAFFAENNLSRNFSNEPSKTPNRETVIVSPGMPYVPSMSLTYEQLPEVMAADSLHKAEVINELQDFVINGRIHTIMQLKSVAGELEKYSNELKSIEKLNRHLILLDHQHVHPLIDSIKLKIEKKKLEIESLQHQVRISEEEIIHI